MQERNTFAVRFYCRDSKANKKGTAPIEMSLIVNGDRVFITLPRKMSPKDFEKDIAKRSSNETKAFISIYESKVNNAVTEILQRNESLTAARIKEYVTGSAVHNHTLKSLISEHLSLIKDRTRSEITLEHYRRYEIAYDTFLDTVGDKELSEVTAADIITFRTEVGKTHQASTAYGYVARIRTLLRFAVQKGWLRSSPADGIKMRKGEKKIEIPTVEEYERIRDRRLDIPRLEKVRQLFVLGCNCGLAYADIMLLRKEDISEKDGVHYIRKNRKKTGVEFTAVILKDGLDILDRIEDIKISNQKLNAYLKEIQDLCGVKCPLSMHRSRHYYITSLIRQGVGLEIVRQCAGHSRITMTQKYMHIAKDDVIKAFAK